MCYFAFLMGYEYVDGGMMDPLIRGFCRKYMDEATASVPKLPIDLDLNDYKDKLIERFSNPIGDHTARICMDGTKKMKEFVAGSVKELIPNKKDVKCAGMLLASWIRYLQGTDENGKDIEVIDAFKE